MSTKSAHIMIWLASAKIVNDEFIEKISKQKPKQGVSEKAKNISDCIQRSGISPLPARELARAFSYAIGEDVPFEDKPESGNSEMFKPYPHAVLVTVGKTSSRYGKSPFMINYSGSNSGALSNDGNTGSGLVHNAGFIGQYRPATPEEIRSFFGSTSGKLSQHFSDSTIAAIEMMGHTEEAAAEAYAKVHAKYLALIESKKDQEKS